MDSDFHIYVNPSTPNKPKNGDSYSVECDVVGPVRIGTPEWTGPEEERVRGLGLGKSRLSGLRLGISGLQNGLVLKRYESGD